MVTRRACQDVVRKRLRRRQEELSDERLSSGQPALEDAVLTGALVRELFRSLRSRDARILEQLYVSGWSIEQVARQLNLSNGHVRVMALRARRRAQKVLEGMGAGRPGLALAPWLPSLLRRLRLPRKDDGRKNFLRTLFEELGLPAMTMSGLGVAALAVGMAVIPSATVLPRSEQPVAARSVAGVPVPAASALSAARAPLQPSNTPVARRRATAGPGQPVGQGPVDFVTGSLAHNQDPQPSDAAFSQFTASPNYGSDRTIFASGSQFRGCAPCPVLFVSHDAGASWRHLAATGFASGQILLPWNYPTDPIILAVGGSGIQRSDDGGDTFRTVVPGAVRAAVEPGQPFRLMLGTSTLPELRCFQRIAQPRTCPATRNRGVDDLAYLGGTQILVVGGERPDAAAQGQLDGVLAVCSSLQCTQELSMPGMRPDRIIPSLEASIDHTLAAMVGGMVFLSPG